MANPTTNLLSGDGVIPDPDPADLTRLLRPREAGRLLGLSEGALAARRSRGQAPPFVRLGPKAIRYQLADLLRFARANKHVSTRDT